MSYLSLGPHLQAALLCERVIPDQGAVTIVRLIDRIVLRGRRDVGPVLNPPVLVACHAVVILKTGRRPGNHRLRLLLRSPSNSRVREFSVPVVLPEQEDLGANIVMPIQFMAKEEGLYWFDVRLNDEELPLTKIPLRLVRS